MDVYTVKWIQIMTRGEVSLEKKMKEKWKAFPQFLFAYLIQPEMIVFLGLIDGKCAQEHDYVG